MMDAMHARMRRIVVVVSLVCSAGIVLEVAVDSDAMRRRVVERLKDATARRGLAAELQGVSLSWRGVVTLEGLVLRLPGGPSLSADRVDITPSYAALLRGEAVVRSVRLSSLSLEAGQDPGAWRQIFAHRAAAPLEPAAPETRASMELSADEVTITAAVGSHELSGSLRDLELELTGGGSETVITGDVALSSGGGLGLQVRAAPEGGASVDIELAEARPADLPRELTRRLPFQTYGTFDGEAHLEVNGVEPSSLSLHLVTTDLTLEGARLAAEPVGPLPLELTLGARWDAGQRRLTLDRLTVDYGVDLEARVEVEGAVEWRPEGAVALSVELERTDTRALVEALPRALEPSPGTLDLDGDLRGAVNLRGPWGHPLEWSVTGGLDLAGLKAAAQARPASWLRSTFLYGGVDPDGTVHQITIGPQDANFVPLDELPPCVADAVVTSEDGGFYGHQGFDFDELKQAAVAVAESGVAVRGGSTITQQLAKNLFLTREKTYARKVREALLTLSLEASVPKERLLEIYLNIIEWGPGIRGIGQAARTYFNKDARALTPKEAVFLASIIPNPTRYYGYFVRHELSDTWRARLDELLTKMKENGRLDADEFAEAQRTPLQFAN